MNFRSKSLLSLSAALCAALPLIVALARAQSSAPPQATPPRLYRAYGKKAPEVYKNIQVLKDIDSTELIPTMQYFADSLGVGCDFCHVPTGSDKDEKANKLEARKMILMTREINKNHFDGTKEVTCTVCHRGAALPVFYPALAAEETTRAAAPAAQPPANLPSAEQILDKYLQAVGGAAALQKISTRIEKGNLIYGDSKIPYEVFSKSPDKRAAITHDPEGDTISAFNGTSAWLEINAPSPPGRDLTPSETAAAKLDADLKFALDAPQILQGLKVLPPEQIDGREMFVLSGKPENMRPVRLYFDAQTGLLTRALRYTEVALGFTPVQVDYADYRAVDGVMIPFRRTQTRPSGRSVIQIDSVQQNVSIPDSRFTKSPPQ